MSNNYIYKNDFVPVEEPDLRKWAMWFQTAERHVIQSRFGKEILVSTVFLGTNHNWFNEGDPILFETMIFGGEHDQYQERYRTVEEARDGHKVAVKLVMKSLKKGKKG